jgi:hypothetical protein
MSSAWLKFENLKWLITTAAIPLTLALLSQQYQCAQSERQATDARLRLYTELLSKREQADTEVRKGIFDKVLDTYLQPAGQDLQAKLVALELLAVNFNDSLDLGPLFWQLDREIRDSGEEALKEQLERVATLVKDRQIDLLGFVGDSRNAAAKLLDTEATLNQPMDVEFSFLDPDPSMRQTRTFKRRFKVEVAEHDSAGRRILVRVDNGERQWMFWVDVFDFPLVNFTRISKDERFTVLLKRYRPPEAVITAIYFPSSRSGVKDKPFIDEVISELKGGRNH